MGIINEVFGKDVFKEMVEDMGYDTEKSETEKKPKIGEYLKEPKFKDVIYEPETEELVKAVLEKLKEGERINLLFYGTQGTGKSFSAKMLSAETNKPLVYITGSQGKNRIIETITNLKPNCLVLVDEIHNLRESVAEVIYPAIQDGEVYLEGNRIEVDAVFVGTTTEPQELPKPLRDRFNEVEMSELEKDKLSELLKRKGVESNVVEYLLNHTTNMRQLNNLLNLLKIFGGYTFENMKKLFRIKGIDIHTGLSKWQKKYLDVLKNMPKSKASLRTICLHLKKSKDYLMEEVEPELIKKNYILITSRGRELNPEFAESGYEQLKEAERKMENEGNYEIDSKKMAIDYLNDNSHIKRKFGNRYFELVNFVAELYNRGIEPDTIDLESCGTDIDFNEYFENEYQDY